ncbi:MAG: Asp-tRNA(Asn)/Glu-tRNA(Gln) amidotransferase subunit GatB, partial [Anaerolineae bacterium]|nr:Asp-tRNA(Asn)/Glu-tRNA(Gln) amidotransferase subunit GatB [Anaerolineae bacterium]
FYPDLPKGYQISQYEEPLAVNGRLPIETPAGRREILVRRVHLEEDTGKLTHINREGSEYSLVDLNRAGVPLLEIVTEPDLHSAVEVRAYAQALRALLRYVGASSGDMEKGALRIEPNISVRKVGQPLGTRVEIKNLASFRVLERAVAYQIETQIAALEAGGKVTQETLGWDESAGATYSQRSKEEAHDYRYFPEPDLPPLVVEEAWVAAVKAALPELPWARLERFVRQYELPVVDARVLVEDRAVADFFEATAGALQVAAPKMAGNWLTGEVFAWMNQSGEGLEALKLTPQGLAELLDTAARGTINLNTAKTVLVEMLRSGQSAGEIIRARGLEQVSDVEFIAGLVRQALQDNPSELAKYMAGKDTVVNWLYGQVMRLGKGKANPQMVQVELEKQLQALKRQ